MRLVVDQFTIPALGTNGTAELWELEVGAQREDARVRGVSKRVIDIELQERIDELSLVVRAAWPIVCPR